MRHTRWLIHYLAGCVAATLIALLMGRVCRCHPHPITLSLGCVAATLISALSLGCVAATLIACTLQGVLLPPSFLP